MKAKRKTAPWIHIVLAIAALAASTGFYSFPLAETPINVDSAVFSYIGRLIAEGGTPYVDAFDHKGPLLYLVNALGALGPSTWMLWIIEWIVLVATLILGYEAIRAVGAPKLAATIISVLFVPYIMLHSEGGNMTEEYCLPFVLATVLLSVRYLKGAPLKAWHAFAMGICWACVALLRFTELAGLAPFAIAVLAVAAAKRSARHAVARTLAFLLGFGVAAGAVAFWLWSMGALSAFAEQYIAFNLTYASDADLNARLQSLAYFGRDQGFLLAVAASIVAGAICRLRKEARCGRDLVILHVNLASLAATFALAATSGRSYGHYLLMLMPYYLVPLAEAARQIHRSGKNRVVLETVAALVVFGLVYLPTSYAAMHEVAYRSTLIEPRAQVVSELREAAGDGEVLVVGNECWIYLDGDFRCPSPYLYRSDAMAKTYDEWLASVISSGSRPSAIAVADYVELDADLDPYLTASTPPGFTIYRI